MMINNTVFNYLSCLLIASIVVGVLTVNSAKAIHPKAEKSSRDSLTFVKYQDRLNDLAIYLKKKGLDIEDMLVDSRFEIYEKIGDRFRKSAERKSQGIEQYKQILGFEVKSQKIVSFMETHYNQLKKAEKTYGIPKYVISAIIGIESDYGRNIGSYNPFNSYVSMYAVDYRSDFARAQLEELLEFTSRKNIDVFELKSSYAGAMSYGQFIPYSINKWFVGDDIFDMNNNIMSVANYLAYFKERTGSIEKAVLRYNPSSLYTRAVLDLAKEAERSFGAGR
jgi:membrane-bound lytic murein transglycosylase B